MVVGLRADGCAEADVQIVLGVGGQRALQCCHQPDGGWLDVRHLLDRGLGLDGFNLLDAASVRIGTPRYVRPRLADHDNRIARQHGLFVTGFQPRDLHGALNTVAQPLNQLGERELCPGSAALEKLNESLR